MDLVGGKEYIKPGGTSFVAQIEQIDTIQQVTLV
jgi:hypothetical protein